MMTASWCGSLLMSRLLRGSVVVMLEVDSRRVVVMYCM